MKDDYLWDKSGEPDPEIEHLERVLGHLRGKQGAQALMPALEKMPRKATARTFTKSLAIAAAVAFVLLGLGVFSLLQRQSVPRDASDSRLAMANPPAPTASVEGNSTQDSPSGIKPDTKAVVTVEAPAKSSRRRSPLQSSLRTSDRRREAALNEREQSEGLMAKEQLLKALEITSSELDFVQKKVQGEEKQGPSS